MTPETSTVWSDPLLLKIVTYLAVFGALTFVTVALVLIAGKRSASGWMVMLSLLSVLGLFIYNEFLGGGLFDFPEPKIEAPPPPPPPAPEPEPEPEPVPEPEPEPEPAKPEKVVPYPLQFIERNVSRGQPLAVYYAQGPNEKAVQEFIFGDAVQSAIWEFPITSGYSKFKDDWKDTLRKALWRFVTFEPAARDKRGSKIRARADLESFRGVMFELGFSTRAVRPRFRIGKNPSSYSAPDLAAGMVKSTLDQSHYSLGGYILTEKGLLKDEIAHLNFFYGGVRYFVDVEEMQDISADGTGDDVLYTVNLTPGAAD